MRSSIQQVGDKGVEGKVRGLAARQLLFEARQRQQTVGEHHVHAPVPDDLRHVGDLRPDLLRRADRDSADRPLATTEPQWDLVEPVQEHASEEADIPTVGVEYLIGQREEQDVEPFPHRGIFPFP